MKLVSLFKVRAARRMSSLSITLVPVARTHRIGCLRRWAHLPHSSTKRLRRSVTAVVTDSVVEGRVLDLRIAA